MNSYDIYIYPISDINKERVSNNIKKYGEKYSFKELTNEHLTKLILLQKINIASNRQTQIYIHLDSEIEIDDFREKLHPKLFNILKYTIQDFNIFINKIDE
jgi:hypothetical protein